MSSFLDPMFPTSITDIITSTDALDQPYVNCIIASINYDIYIAVQNQNCTYFLYDSTEWLQLLSSYEQQSRIIDKVIQAFRLKGIRVAPANFSRYNQYKYYAYDSPYNLAAGCSSGDFRMLNVHFSVNNEQEYMKSYLD